jgi:flagellar hook assembly protein FlgD
VNVGVRRLLSVSAVTAMALTGLGSWSPAQAAATLNVQAPQSRYFSPNADGYEDAFSDNAYFSEAANVTVTIKDSGGTTVHTATGTTNSSLAYPVTWDGTKNDSTDAPAGEYTVVVAGHGLASGTDSTDTLTLGIDRSLLAVAIASPDADSTVHANETVHVTVANVGDLQLAQGTLEEQVSHTPIATTYGWSNYEDQTYLDFIAQPGSLDDGSYPFVAHLQFYDPLYYFHDVYSAPRTFVTVTAPTLEILSQPHVIFPNWDSASGPGAPTSAFVSLRLGQRATSLTTDLTDSEGVVIRTFRNAVATAGGYVDDPFEMRTSSAPDAPLLADGTYTYRAHAVFPDSTVKDATLQLGVSSANPSVALTAPTAGSTLTGPTPATVTATGGVKISYVNVSSMINGSSYGLGGGGDMDHPAASVDFTLDPAPLADGPATVDIYAPVVDALGASVYLPVPSVSFTIDAAMTIEGDTDPVVLTIDNNPAHGTVATDYTVSRDATVTSQVFDSGDTLVKTLEADAAAPKNVQRTVSWDGTTGTGGDAPEGTYTLKVHAVSGTHTADLSRTITLTRTTAGTLLSSATGSVSGTLHLTYQPDAGVDTSSLYYAPLYDGTNSYPIGGLYQEYDTDFNPTGVFSTDLDTTFTDNGPHALYVKVGELETPRVDLTFANPVHITNIPTPATFHPGDPLDDSWPSYGPYIDQPGTVTATIRNSADEVVRVLTTESARGTVYLPWDGKNSDGAEVPDGDYAVAFHVAEGVVPSSDDASTTVTVGSRHLGTVTVNSSEVTVGESLQLTFTPVADLPTPDAVSFGTSQYGMTAGELQGDGTWTATIDTSQLVDGDYSYFAAVGYQDAEFNYHYEGTRTVKVTVSQPKTVTKVSGDRSFSPNGDGYEDYLQQSIRLSRHAAVTVTFAPKDGAVAKTLDLGSLSAGDNYVSWDGTGATPGDWTMHLHAVDDSNAAQDLDIPIVVMGTPGTLTVAKTTEEQPYTLTWTAAAGTTTDNASLYRIKHGASGSPEYVGELAATATPGVYSLTVDPAAVRELVSCSSSCVYRNVDLPNGTWDYTTQVAWTDAAGAARDSSGELYTSPATGVTSSVAPRIITPVGNGFIGSNGIDAAATYSSSALRTSQPTNVSVVVTATDGSPVTTLGPFEVTKDSSEAISWDGAAVPDGSYTLNVVATEPVSGKTGTSSSTVVVRRAAVGSFTAPAADEVVAGTVHAVWHGADGVDVKNVRFVDSGGFQIGQGVKSGSDWAADIPASDIGDGPVNLDATVTWQDATGAQHAFHDRRHVDVQQTPHAFDLPGGSWFTPNGDGLQDSYRATFGTSARGLLVNATVVDANGDLVRTLLANQPSNGQYAAQCDNRASEYQCDVVTWDGLDGSLQPAANGLYTLKVVVANVAGATDTITTPVGVERRSPVSSSLVDGATIADALDLTYSPTAAFNGTTKSVTVGVSGVLSAVSATAQSDSTWTAHFDLPSSLPTDLPFLTSAVWEDGYGQQHQVVTSALAHLDRTTLDLAATMTKTTGYDPMATSFGIGVGSGPSAGGPVHWTVDPGDGSTPIEGDLASPYPPFSVPYTYVVPGTYSALVTVTSGLQRRHEPFAVTVRETPPVRPAVTLSVTPTKGIAPVDATATVGATTTDGSPMTYTVDWGDGTVTEPAPISGTDTATHTFATPATDPRGYRVQLTVIAKRGSTTTTTYQDTRVVVGKDEPLAAVSRDAGNAVVAVDGQAVVFDGSGSTPAAGIDSYGWDFGDGSSSADPITSHAFDDPGVYIVNLTVTKGTETKTSAETVRVLDKTTTSVSKLTVTDAGGGGLAGAIVAYRSPEGDLTRATTDGDGVATLYGLPEGDTAMDVYAPDHTPSVGTVTVTDKVGTGRIDLPRGPLGEATVTTTRISPDIAASQYGVDLDSEDNQLFNEYSIELHYYGVDGDQQLRVRGAFTPDGSVGKNIFEDPNGNPPNDCIQKDDLGNEHYICYQGGIGGAQIQAEVQPTGPNQDPTLIVMAVKVKGGQLKEFYGVDLIVKNLAAAGSTATLEDLRATVDYDHTGLSLAAVTGTPQSDTQTIEGSIPAQGESTASWVLAGDKAGTYPVKVLIDGRLMPFDVPAQFESKPSNVTVYGADSLKLVVQAPAHVDKDQPAHYRIGFENTTKDAPVYGVSVEIPPSGDKYQIQPGQDPVQVFKDPIQPGKREFVDYYLVPSFTGDLNLQESVISHTKGDATKTPVLEPLDDTDPDNQQVHLTATATPDGRTQVTWDPVPGATSYRLFAPASLAGGFGEPVGTYSDLSTVIDTPDSFVEGSALRTTSLRTASLRTASLESSTASFVKQLVLQSVVKGASQLRHNIANAVAAYTCGQTQTVAGVTLSGCLNKQADGSYLADSSQGKIAINGLVVEPVSGDVKVKISSATNAISASAQTVKVGLDLGGAGVVPLYQGPLSLDLTKDWSLALSPKNLLGLPVSGSATLHKTADGTSSLTVKAAAPALLGGAVGDLKLSTSASGGASVDGVSFAISKGNLGGLVGYSGSLDMQSATSSGSTWNVSGTAGSATASGSLSFDQDGKVTSGSLHAGGFNVAGLLNLTAFDLSSSGGGSWSGSMTGTSGGVAADISGTYTVDEATNKVTSGSLKASKVAVKDLFALTNFALTYAGTDASTWAATGTVVAAGATPTFSATLASDADGIASGHLSVTKLPFGGLATLQDLGLAYDRDAKSWSAAVTVDLPGAPAAGKGTFTVVDNVLQDVHVAMPDVHFGGLAHLRDASFDYTAASSSYKLVTSTADIANLVGLTSFSAQRNDTSWAVSGAGSDGSVSGSLTYTGGELTAGSLSIEGVNLIRLLPVGRIDLSFGGGSWSAAAGPDGGPEVSFTVTNGKVAKGSIKVPKATLAGVIPVGFHMDYDGDADTWSAGGDAALPGGKTGAMSVDVTYTKGVLTDAALKGTIGLKGGLELQNLDVSYASAGDTWHGGLDVVLPGPLGTTIGGTLDLANGAFVGASAKVNGVSVPLGAGVFLTDADVAVQLEPTILLQGRIALSVGPKVAGQSAVSVDTTGRIEMRDDGSALYSVDGKAFVVGNELANAGFAYDTNGEATFHGGFGYGIPGVARVSADLKGGVNANGFNSLTGAQLELLGMDPASLPSAQAVVSTRGVAACAKLAPQFDWQTGFGYSWGGSPQLLEKSCDIGPWIDSSAPQVSALRVAPRAGRSALRASLVPAPGFSVPAGQKVMALEWVGASAPPVVTLTSPSGAVLVTPTDAASDGVQPGGNWVSLRNGVTRYVLLDHPEAGNWTVSVEGDVVSSATAAQAPVTSVTGSLTGTGTSRTLSYTVTGPDSVRFIESLPSGGTRELGAADGTGSLAFTTVPGAGTRTITAVVESDGAFVRAIDLLSYDVANDTVMPIGGGSTGGTTGGTTGGATGGTNGGGTTGGTTGGTSGDTTGGTTGSSTGGTTGGATGGTSGGTTGGTSGGTPGVVDKLAPRVGVAVPPAVALGGAGVHYAAVDDLSGVATYDVRYRRAPLNGLFGSYGYPAAWQGTTNRTVGLAPVVGSTYCFSVRARDKAGNVSAWSGEQCSTSPIDDRHLAPSTGWTRGSASAYYLGTISKASAAGRTLTRTGVVTRYLSLVATTCGTCGSVDVFWNGNLLRTISLNGPLAYRKVISVGDFGTARSGTLVLKTRTAARVYIDGVALRRG